MLKKNFLSICVLLLGLSQWISAQELDVEKTYQISGKAKRGMLKNVAIDESSNNVDLTYVTKSNNKKAKFETYRFDLDFNFKEKIDDEIEFEKAKTKYKWFKFKGEEYVVEGLKVAPNLMGKLVLKKKRVTYKYNWFLGGYNKTTKLLAKVKPQDDAGRKFWYYRHAEYDNTGSVMVITGVMDKMGKNMDGNRPAKEFHMLKFDKDVKLLSDTKLLFDYPQSIVSSATLAPEVDADGFTTDEGYDYILVFAPKFVKKGKEQATNYTYVRLSTDGVVKERVSFESPNGIWNAENIIEDKQGNILVFGPANDNQDKFFSASDFPKKFLNFQIMKVTNGKVAYITTTNLDEFESKMKAPVGQKKNPAYKGKKFILATADVLTNGDLVITGQNNKTAKEGTVYKDVLMFHFDSKGILKAQYGVVKQERGKVSNSVPVNQHIIESADGKSFYWTIMEIKGLRTNKELGTAKVKVLNYPSVAKISIANATIGEFKPFGDGKYFLNDLMPLIPISSKGAKLLFFGENKKGSELWFGRMPLD